MKLLAHLDTALERLPEAFRAVLVLRLRHDLSVPEIAAALDRAPAAGARRLVLNGDFVRSVTLELELRDADSHRVWTGLADLARTPPVARVSAPPCEYSLWAGAEGGLGGHMAFHLGSLGGDEPRLTLALLPDE